MTKNKPGDRVFTYLLGFVELVREMNGQSGVDGWEVRRSDGTLSYLTYEDFNLTQEEIDEVRAALRKAQPPVPPPVERCDACGELLCDGDEHR